MTYKVLYISAVIPDTTSGGRFAMYRHLIIKKDFEVAVASTNFVNLPIKYQLSIRRNRLVERLRRTRLCRLICNLEYLINWVLIPSRLIDFAKGFQPDVIVTVVDDWHIGLAVQLAKKLNIPLVANFQDLFCLSQFVPLTSRPYSLVQSWLIKGYHQVNQSANQVFYTSEGMKNWFGINVRGDVLYPIGDFSAKTYQITNKLQTNPAEKIKIIYAGNCYGAYGRMLLRLAELAKNTQSIELKIFAAGNDWHEDKIQEMKQADIYQGFKPFKELRIDFENADGFLTVMSFEESQKVFMQTSFTTKWLDYVPYAKPVFVWGPEYSTAFNFAKKYKSGITVSEDKPESLIQIIETTMSNMDLWHSACQGSSLVANTVLNSENIHSLFVEKLVDVCSQNSFKNKQK